MNDFKKFERDAWEQKADRYQNTWGKVSNQTIDPLLQLIESREEQSLLDCGCGTGHFCKQASEQGLSVTGSDYSEKMIEIASSNFPDLNFTQEDAENLSFKQNTFDTVTMNYLLLHVSNQGETLKEAIRVLKPEGQILYSMWLSPLESPGLALMMNAVKKHADLSVIPPAQDIFLFSNYDFAQGFLKDQGLKSITKTVVNTYWEVVSPEKFFNGVQAGTRIGGTIDLQEPEVKAKIKADIFENIEQYKQSDSYIIPTPSLIVSAFKS